MVYVQLVLDDRKKNESGVYSVKLRITHHRVQKYYLTGYKMTEAEFTETLRNPPAKRLQDRRVELDHVELKARKIISKMEEGFSFLLFEEKFLTGNNPIKTLYQLYEEIINTKTEEEKIGTASNYRCSLHSLKKFEPSLSFVDVTPDFLRKYERYLLAEGKSISTVGIYLRPLRAILNEAIARKLLSSNLYPFGKRKYVIPASQNIKKALSRDDLKKIVDYNPNGVDLFERRSRDFWLLSYLCQGMNPKDLLLLKKTDVDGDFIKFVRQKTKDTTRANLVEIVVPLLPEAKELVQRWRCTDEDSPFLFKFIREGMTALEKHKAVQQFVKVTNKHMKRIGDALGIQKKCTCYSARYGFTQALIEADVSVEYIRQCLGHQSPTTTLRYINSFENSKRMEIASKHLLRF